MSMASQIPAFDPDFAGLSEWAAMYRACGIQVVPSYLPGERQDWKQPRHRWKEFQEELVSDGLFQKWFPIDAKTNMGLLCGRCSGGIFVIDLDTYKGSQSSEWWQGLLVLNNYGQEPETWNQRTGGGGRQIFFRAPDGWTPPTNKTTIDVDFRGQAGFAVLPPSKHSSGNEYAWEPGCAPWEIEIAEAPDWLLTAIEDLVEAHGGSPERRAPDERVNATTVTDAFGNTLDGREKKMRDIVWKAVLDLYRKSPIPPAAGEQRQAMEDAYALYERDTKSRLTGADKTAALDREGRGPRAFAAKWRHTMKKWGEAEFVVEAAKPNPNAKPPEPEPEPEIDPATGEPLPLLLSAAQFIAGFTPPEYLVHGMLQRGYLYSLTARTGHGKTAVSMYMAQAIARGLPVHGREVKKGTVLLLAGENPDDIRARYLVLADAHGFKAEDLAMRFVAGVVDIAASMSRIRAEAETIDDLVLVIVDTAAAYFKGDDGNSNAQMGEYARLLRQLTFLPGKPAVLVNCHPVKNASKENLTPLGGGAFLNEVDGNLTLWSTAEKQTTLHWQGKFRGPEFEPITFEMKTVESERVCDSDGQLMPSVVAEPVSERRLEMAEKVQEAEEENFLSILARNPKASIASLAIKCGFVSGGNPQKSKVFRLLKTLQEDKLVERVRGKYRITKKGKAEIGWEENDD